MTHGVQTHMIVLRLSRGASMQLTTFTTPDRGAPDPDHTCREPPLSPSLLLSLLCGQVTVTIPADNPTTVA